MDERKVRDLNRKLWWASVLVMITIFGIIFDRLTGCSRDEGVKERVVIVEPPKVQPTEQPPPIKNPSKDFLSLDEIEQAALEDISRPELNQADRENYRYLLVSDVFNEGGSIDKPAMALSKAVNQVSRERFLQVAVPIDKEQTIYRIDLRDYFGARGRAVWQRIEKDLVIKGIVSRTIRGQTLQFLTQAVQPWVHGRLFCETVLLNETYYDILGIPKTLAEFYQDFAGVVPQVEFDARDPGVVLVGTQESVIGQNNRLMWRLEGRDGPVYQTFDVDDNNIGREQNLFENPFVVEVNPLGRVVTNKIFKHAASETLSILPNGLMAGALWAANGIRQNAAPQTVVTNVRAVGIGLSSEIRNARDCSGCHQSGFIAIRDEVGAQIQRSATFNAQDKALGSLFFRRQDIVDAFMAQDNSQYQKALGELSIQAGPDPINDGLLDAIRTGVNSKEAAAFFFLEERDFLERLQGAGTSQGEVGTLLRGGSISFQQFVISAPQIIADLNLFIDIE